jgi:hypothetical protein
MAEITVDMVCAKYVETRAQIEKLMQAHKEELAPFKDQLDRMAAWLQATLLERKEQSVRTESGTVYLQRSARLKIVDRDLLTQFSNETANEQFFEVVVNEGAVKDYIEEHYGSTVPGVELTYVIKAMVRKL